VIAGMERVYPFVIFAAMKPAKQPLTSFERVLATLGFVVLE
jgi:branched-subunit amino acid transport protein AzlD